MNTAKLTVRLPPGELEFARGYARKNGLSLTALIRRYLGRLRSTAGKATPPEVAGIAGIVPPQVNAHEDYADHIEQKHR